MLKSTPLFIGITAVLLGVIVYQARRIGELNAPKGAQPISTQSVSNTPAVDPRERERLAGELAAARWEISRLRQMAEPKAAPADGIAGRVAALKETLQRLPEQQIPQLAYATEADWYAAVEGALETAEDFRMAMARLRNSAYSRFAKLLQPALKEYMKANGGRFPQEALQVQPFFTTAVEPAALRNLQVVRANSIKNVRMGGEWAITQVAVVDSAFDAHIVVGPNGFGSYGGPRK